MTLRLTASSATLRLTVTAPQVAAADTPSRTIKGLAAPYGVAGSTSAGVLTIAQGGITLPDDLKRVKLVDGHQQPPVAVGYAIAAEDSADGLVMTFYVAKTAEGDAALLAAQEGTKDALSVELVDVVKQGDTVTGSLLSAVAQVPIPAFAPSRITDIAASHTAQEGTAMKLTPEQIARLAALRAQETLTHAEATELAELVALEAGETDASTETAENTATAPAVAAAAAPSGLTTVTARPSDPNQVYAALARVHTGASRPTVEAALSNITNTANIYVAQTSFEGQLWSGLRYARRYVPLMTPKRLTSYKMQGWRWNVKPAVADYAGDKAAVPSNAPTTTNVEVTAARLAGAHDIDRKFRDFGDVEFFKAYYEAMTESYGVQSDDKARAAIIAAAYVSATTLSKAAGNSIIDAALQAKIELEITNNVGSPDFYLVNVADWQALMRTKASDLRAYLDALGIDPAKFIPTTGVAADAVIAGVKAATTWYELGETPVRADAVDMVNGGEDAGVFGYYATLTNHAKGVVRVNLVA